MVMVLSTTSHSYPTFTKFYERPDTTYITSLPYTISQSNRCYVVDGSLRSTSPGAAITISGAYNILLTGSDSVTIDTIYVGIGASNQAYDSTDGIRIMTNADGITIRYLAVVNDGCLGDTNSYADTAFATSAIDATSSDSLFMTNCYFESNGWSALMRHDPAYPLDSAKYLARFGIIAPTIDLNGCYNVVMESCVVDGNQMGMERRDYYEMSAISVEVTPLANFGIGDSSLYITNCRVFSRNVGISYGKWGSYSSLLSAKDCYFETDELNEIRPHFMHDSSNMYCGNANSFNIVMYGSASGYIRGCTLVCGDSLAGANGGIMAEGSPTDVGSLDSALIIEDCVIRLNHGYDTRYGTGINAKAIKFRQQNVDNLWIIMRNNKIYGYTSYTNDTGNPTGYGPIVTAVYADTRFTKGYFLFENNLIRVMTLDTNLFTVDAAYGEARWPRVSAYTFVGGSTWGGITFEFKNNRIETNGAYVIFGAYDATMSGLSEALQGDTIQLLTNSDTGEARDMWPALVAFWDENTANASYDNVVLDAYIVPPHDTLWHSVVFRSGIPQPMDVTFKKTFILTCIGPTGDSLENIQVYCIDAQGDTVIDALTNANGQVIDTVNTYYDQDNRSPLVDINYNPFIFKAIGSTSEVTINLDLDTNSNVSNINLNFSAYSIMYEHTSIYEYLMTDSYTPYTTGIKTRLDSLGNAHSTTLRMWDYRTNTASTYSWAGWRTARFDSTSSHQHGWMKPQPNNDCYNFSGNNMFIEHINTYFWNIGMSKDSIKGGFLLVDTVKDEVEDTLIDITDFDMLIFGFGPPIWCGENDGDDQMSAANIATKRTEAFKWRDSALNYPDIQFVYELPNPIMYGTTEGNRMSETEIENQFWFNTFWLDTLEDTANYPNFHTISLFDILVEKSQDSTKYGFIKTIYENNAYHPNAVAGDTAKEYMIDMWLPEIIFTEGETPSPTYDQTLTIIDTSETFFTVQDIYTGTVDSLKIFWDTDSDVFDGSSYLDETSLSTPDTLFATSLIVNTQYYFRVLLFDGAVTDTSSLGNITTHVYDQTITIIDTTNSTFKIQDAYTGIADSLVLYYDTDSSVYNGSTKKDITTLETPDTLTATGLIQNTKYYLRVMLFVAPIVDTSAIDSVTTLDIESTTRYLLKLKK